MGRDSPNAKKIVTKTKYPTPFYFNGDFIIILMICNIIPHLFNNQLLDCTLHRRHTFAGSILTGLMTLENNGPVNMFEFASIPGCHCVSGGGGGGGVGGEGGLGGYKLILTNTAALLTVIFDVSPCMQSLSFLDWLRKLLL